MPYTARRSELLDILGLVSPVLVLVVLGSVIRAVFFYGGDVLARVNCYYSRVFAGRVLRVASFINPGPDLL